jgi:hypothetical protein
MVEPERKRKVLIYFQTRAVDQGINRFFVFGSIDEVYTKTVGTRKTKFHIFI